MGVAVRTQPHLTHLPSSAPVSSLMLKYVVC